MLTGILLATAAAAAAPNDYALGQNWLCRPDRRDVCSEVSLTVTEIAANGRQTELPAIVPIEPTADCFYVYPTLSLDPQGNSDMVANEEERSVTETQFARFRTVCATYAPLYRQSTLAWLRSNMTPKPIPVDMELRYTDVRDAWRHYLAQDNKGRPFVLIGHSQGSGLLKRLIKEEIEGKPAAGLMLSAMLAGTNLVVAKGKDVGGDLASTPLCRSATQTGCVMAWASFRETAPPPANTRYGKSASPDTEIACTNPAALQGGSAELRAIFPTRSVAGAMSTGGVRWTVSGPEPKSSHVTLPGLYSGACKTLNGANVLAVRLAAPQKNARVRDPGGDLKFGTTIASDWGLHLIDMNLVMGDLLLLVSSQEKAWAAKRK